MSKKSSRSGLRLNSTRASAHRRLLKSKGLTLAELRRHLTGLANARGRALIAEAKRLIQDKRLPPRRTRIVAVKLLVADLPRSLGIIRRVLADFSKNNRYELHFTLFCWLDREHLPANLRLRNQILSAVCEYLFSVRSEKGYGAWMAGDLLGDHWRTRSALRCLRRLALEASHPAGRKGAIHGLEKAYSWSTPSARASVRRLLTKSSRSDPSDSVREAARLALGRLAGGPRSRHGPRSLQS